MKKKIGSSHATQSNLCIYIEHWENLGVRHGRLFFFRLTETSSVHLVHLSQDQEQINDFIFVVFLREHDECIRLFHDEDQEKSSATTFSCYHSCIIP